ncbi:MAG: hypothetical protein ACFFED_06550 [Candidatus Thorarchaeota archaeon]
MATSKQLVIDWSDVHEYDQKVLVSSLPLFVAYGFLLSLICALGDDIITGLVFVVTQLAIGLPASRYANNLGRRAKAKLTLQDPSMLKNGWRIEEKETHNSDMKRIFEGFSKSIKEADTKTADDVNDVAWFIITVWTMISALISLTFGWNSVFCIPSAIVLGGVCFLTYYYGHRGLVNGYFEDDLAHLEYYVQSRISFLASYEKDAIQKVIWKTKNSKMVLYDFVIYLNTSDTLTFAYYVGIPSAEKERFSIRAKKRDLESIYQRIQDLNLTDWHLDMEDENHIALSFLGAQINLRERKTFIQSPEEPAYLRDTAQRLLTIISESMI